MRIILYIPEAIWKRMLDGFATTEGDVERVAYLDGIEINEVGVVTTLTFPNALLLPGSFAITPDAMSRAGMHLRDNSLVRLAQVHTHPGSWIGHSPIDDARAYSQLPGAISVVLPDHARSRPYPTAGGIHVRTRQGWRQSSPENVLCEIRIVPSLIDQRLRDDKRPEKDTLWKRCLTAMRVMREAFFGHFRKQNRSR